MIENKEKQRKDYGALLIGSNSQGKERDNIREGKPEWSRA
jgi:hypothetical protein